jgi:hypothetical protein
MAGPPAEREVEIVGAIVHVGPGSSGTRVCMEMDGRKVMTLNSFEKISLSLAFLMRRTR